MPLIEMVGKTFGQLTVIRRDGSDSSGRPVWMCRCSCGSSVKVRGTVLRKRQRSCGCGVRAQNTESLLGRRFGRLVVSEACGRASWRCVCDCAGTRVCSSSVLLTGSAASCGCVDRERRSSRTSKHPLYVVWSGMVQRCTNAAKVDWSNYGGRGISVCDRWRHSFPSFLEDMGERPSPAHSLDRINNDGNYEPGNVRWATRGEQNRNRRDSKISLRDIPSIVAAAEIESHRVIAERYGVTRSMISLIVRRAKLAKSGRATT